MMDLRQTAARDGIPAHHESIGAPSKSSSTQTTTAQLLDAVRAHALIGLDPGNISEITVTRASRAISTKEIEALVTTALAKSYSLGVANDISVSFDRPLRVAPGRP